MAPGNERLCRAELRDPRRPRHAPAPPLSRGRGKQDALHPKPHARKRLTRLRTSHFVPSTSAEGPWRLLSPPDCSAPSGAAEALLAPPGRPAGPRPRPPPPRPGLPFRPLPPPTEGGSRATAAFTSSSSCGRKVHRAPGPLSGGCAAAPRRAAHKAAPRVPPPPPPPARERRWGWRCRGGAAAAGGDAGRVCAGRGDTAALRLAEEEQPQRRHLRERVRPCPPGTPAARPPTPRAGRLRRPGPGRSSQRRAPGRPCPREPALRAHTSRSRERCESTREQGARLAPSPSSAGRASASLGPEAAAREADSAATRLAPRLAPLGGLDPKGKRGGAPVAGREPGPRGPCEGTQDELSFTLCREDEFMTFGVHPERHGRNWLKDG
ncbi:formin-like protein 5 [Neomonachus schauinslandi]|uniref:Formin-like protein 5 n=1 Tax=Neomonachus schauinslandi TaxID=29088 RepID=A0A8M1M7P5_NEOSC|nr:formin-like protein 5 [Neomonachus schauinslandi]